VARVSEKTQSLPPAPAGSSRHKLVFLVAALVLLPALVIGAILLDRQSGTEQTASQSKTTAEQAKQKATKVEQQTIRITRVLQGKSVPGLNGEAGQRGQPGPQGPIGPFGVPGQSGTAGAQGSPGENGVNGDPGPQGTQGDPGAQGDPGLTGPTGPEPTSFTFSIGPMTWTCSDPDGDGNYECSTL
jgi:hypothetical protein